MGNFLKEQFERNEAKVRKGLYRQLYNAARHGVDPAFKNDGDAVRAFRDNVVSDLYKGRYYDDLTNAELLNVINEINTMCDAMPPVELVASKWQLKLLRYYAVACAIYYLDFAPVSFTIEETGEILEGSELQAWLKERFESKIGIIPANIYAFLFAAWVNPKSHRFMLEGGFKEAIYNKSKFYYEKLHPKQASYLITRYQQIYNNITQGEISNDVEIQANMN